jgi:hypothetical protein
MHRLSPILAVLIAFISTAHAQSGRAVWSGWVSFDGVAYVDKQPAAKVELFRPDDLKTAVATTETGEHGHYDFTPSPLGELVLRISAPGYATYETTIYLPSDFAGNLGTLLKKSANLTTQKK